MSSKAIVTRGHFKVSLWTTKLNKLFMKFTKHFNFRVTAVLLFSLVCMVVNAQDWAAIPIPADAGAGNAWIIDNDASDDFNYTFNATTTRTNFGPVSDSDKWINFFHNNYQGPGPTNWEEENVSVSGGFLRLLNDREFNNGVPVMKTFGNVTRPETRAACITGAKRVIYPVFVEAKVRVMNSALATDVWLLSPDDTQEIDIIECYGGPMSDNRNSFFAPSVHLSHHVFVRSPFKDYQPADWNSWYRKDGVTQWGGVDIRIGIYWKSPTILEYYIDGELVRVINNDAVASRLPDGTWEYTYPTAVTSTEQNGQLVRFESGQKTGYQAMTVASSLEEAKKLSEISVIDPFNYLGNDRRFSKEMDIIINTEDQSWQAEANRSPNNTEILNATDNTMLVDWIRVYKPEPTGDRARSLSFDNKSNYILSGDALPTFTIGERTEIDVTYATGIAGGIEEDLNYVATQIQQLDENDQVVGVSSFISPITGNEVNATSTSIQYEIPTTFNDGTTPIPSSANLPIGHKLKLLFYMSVDGDAAFADASEEIILDLQAPRERSITFDNKSDYILAGETVPSFELSETFDVTVTYATGISNGIEEDLGYIATMLRQVDASGATVKTSAFNVAIEGTSANAATTTYQFTIPTTYNDDSPVIRTDNLPVGHNLKLIIFMSVDGDTGFADGSEEIILTPPAPRERSITFDNKSDYILAGETVPTFDLGQTFDITTTYATGVANEVEEDLHYVATMLREVDASGAAVKTSAFNVVIEGTADNVGTSTYQFTIPTTFSDGSPVVRTSDLPVGHKLKLLVFMSVNGDTGFADGSVDIILAPPAPRNRSITFDNKSDYILSGDTDPTFELNQTVDIIVTYATGVVNEVEEDLHYVATMLRQVDGNDNPVNTSTFNVAIEGTSANAATTTYQFTIPTTFSDGSPVPTTEDLPTDNKLILLIFMSVDGDTGFAVGSSEAKIVSEGSLSVSNLKKNKEIVVSPNPFTSELLIDIDTNIPWKLYNIQGQQVLSGSSNRLKGDFLIPGLYFLSIDNKQVIKVIKN